MIEREIPGKPPRRFPAKEELVAHLVSAGLIKDEQELLSRRPDLIGNLMLSWIQHSQTGCRFATHLAKHREKAGWYVATLVEHMTDKSFSEAIDAVLAHSPTMDEMVMFVFPWVQGAGDLVELVRQLVLCKDWWWEQQYPVDSSECDDVLIGLRWMLPSRESQSWVLGFAPFSFMPFTRRSPYAAIVLRPKDPHQEHRPEEGRANVHLAQVPHFLGERGRFEGEVWMSTKEQRAELLQGELAFAARARVTFLVPKDWSDRLAPAEGPPTA